RRQLPGDRDTRAVLRGGLFRGQSPSRLHGCPGRPLLSVHQGAGTAERQQPARGGAQLVPGAEPPGAALMAEPATRLTAALADRFRLERELGQGCMATVYLAQALTHDRAVAIKVPNLRLAAVLRADRFVIEIKTTAALQHPHILPLFD